MPMLTNVISCLASALPATRANRLLILIYHRVRPEPDPMYPLEVHAERFDRQMQLLRRHCRPVAMLDALRALRVGKVPPRAVAVTFDDGYADNATTALPILLRHGIPATFFVAPGFLDGGLMWNDSIIEAVRRAPGPALDLTGLGHGVIALDSARQRGEAADAIIRAVKHMRPADRADRCSALVERINADLPTDLMMTSRQVRELADAGMDVGAHTMSHPILRTLDTDDARREIADSRDVLQQITGRKVQAFAYPNGKPDHDYTGRDREIVAALGFQYACSTRYGAACTDSDMFQLPRLNAWDVSPARWLARILTMFRLQDGRSAA